MKKLSKEHEKKIAEIEQRWVEKRAALMTAIEEANGAIDALNRTIEEARADLNAVVAEANEVRDEIEQAISSYMDDRSDSWKESDRGGEYEDWRSKWETEVEEIEEIEFEKLDEPDISETCLDDMNGYDREPS